MVRNYISSLPACGSIGLGSRNGRFPIFAVFLFAICSQGAELTANSGIVEPFYDAVLSASVPGIVTVKNLREGDLTKEGDLILELDKNLEELEVVRRKLLLDQKRKDFEGTRKLFETTKGVSKEEVEKKEVEYRVAVTEHEMAVEQLRRRRIISPISGTITDIAVDPGEACQPYQPLARIVDTRRCYLVANIEPKSAGRLKVNQTVRLEIDAGVGPVQVDGNISFLSPILDAASGLRKVKVLFSNADGRIQAGAAGRMLLE